jgi:hypothetical protein
MLFKSSPSRRNAKEGAATQWSTFFISRTNVSTILVTMHPYFNDFMFQRFIQYVSTVHNLLYSCTVTCCECVQKNSIFCELAYDILELDHRKGSGAQAEQSDHTPLSKLPLRVDTKFCQNFATFHINFRKCWEILLNLKSRSFNLMFSTKFSQNFDDIFTISPGKNSVPRHQ